MRVPTYVFIVKLVLCLIFDYISLHLYGRLTNIFYQMQWWNRKQTDRTPNTQTENSHSLELWCSRQYGFDTLAKIHSYNVENTVACRFTMPVFVCNISNCDKCSWCKNILNVTISFGLNFLRLQGLERVGTGVRSVIFPVSWCYCSYFRISKKILCIAR